MISGVTLDSRLAEATRRIRIRLAVQWAGRTLLVSSLFCFAWLIAGKLGWLALPSESSISAILGVALLSGLLFSLTRPVTRMDVARLTDGKTEFKDRLASAVEFQESGIRDPLVLRQVEDASARAAELDIRKAFPIRVTRETAIALVIVVILFLAFLLPTMPVFWPKAKREEFADVKKQAAEMQKIVRITEKKADQQKLDESKKAAKEADKMLEAMRKSNVTKKAAMIQLAKMTKQLEEQQKRVASVNAPAQKSLQKAGEDIKKALEQKQEAISAADKAKRESGKAGKQEKKPGDKSEENKKDGSGEKQSAKAGQQKPSESMQQAQQALQKFAQALSDQNTSQQTEALQQLADQMEKGQMSREEQQTLQQQLQQMAQALKGTELQKVSEQMSKMAQSMHQIKLDPETLKNLAKMMRQAAGQCQGNGQMKLDAKTLAELLQAIKDGKLKLASGSGGIPLPLPIKVPGKGNGTNGMGQHTNPLKGEQASSPKAVALGKNSGLSVDSRVSKEFIKYAAMGHKDSKFKPNTQIKGNRNNNVTELQMNYKGDPDSDYAPGTPLFQPNGQPRRGLESAINRENIPAAYRKQVKDYFESINPNK